MEDTQKKILKKILLYNNDFNRNSILCTIENSLLRELAWNVCIDSLYACYRYI